MIFIILIQHRRILGLGRTSNHSLGLFRNSTSVSCYAQIATEYDIMEKRSDAFKELREGSSTLRPKRRGVEPQGKDKYSLARLVGGRSHRRNHFVRTGYDKV